MAFETVKALAQDEQFRATALQSGKRVGRSMVKGFGMVETDPVTGATRVGTSNMKEFMDLPPAAKALRVGKEAGKAIIREAFVGGKELARSGRHAVEERQARNYANSEYSDVGLTEEDHSQTDHVEGLFTPEAEAYLNGLVPEENPTAQADHPPTLGKTVPFRPSRVPVGDPTLHFGTKPEDFGWQTPGDYGNN